VRRARHRANGFQVKTLFALGLGLAFGVPLWQPSQTDPHRGRFTTGVGLRCAYCHNPSNPRAEDMYRAAGRMAKMVDGLNRGALRQLGPIDCVTCHREGGPDHVRLHPEAFNRGAVQQLVTNWPADPRDKEDLRRAMATYAVSLGVNCEYCHVGGNWKAPAPMQQTSRAMIEMMNEFPKYFDFANASAFTCYTCHLGAAKIPKSTR
jgi:Photosynthetic reaction centre cytochrome C subunit